MSEWTAKRLMELPDHTVILCGVEYLRRDREYAGEAGFVDPRGLDVDISEVLATTGTISVISVPVSALMQAERDLAPDVAVAINGTTWAPARPVKELVEHVIGGAS